MNCKYCGKPLPEENKFCIYCGQRAEASASVSDAQPVYTPPAGNTPPVSYAPAPKKKSGAGMVVTVVVLVILVVALLLALIVMALNGGSFSLNIPERSDNENSGYSVDDENERNETENITDEIPVYSGILSASNPYAACYDSHSSYVLTGSDSSYKCYSDISGLTDEERYIAQQEIYARHGKQFSDPDVQEYFDNRSWYTPGTGSFEPNTYEQANLDLLEVYEAKQNGSLRNSGNPYLSLYYNVDYAVAGSSSRYLNAQDLKDMGVEELCVVRNEILARYGWIFSDADLREYFYSKAWYKPSVPGANFDATQLNKYEQSNVKFVQAYEKREKGLSFSSDNPYKSYYSAYQDHIFSNSSSRRLTQSNVSGMTADELCLARNEIFARNGYTFTDDHLLEYFLHFDWYNPNTPPGDSSSIAFTSIELDNISFLREQQTVAENGGTVGGSQSSGSSQAVKVDEYTYTMSDRYGTYCYHIPVVKLSGVNADSVNQKMYNTHYANAKKNAFDIPEQIFMFAMIYTVKQYGDIVSVMVQENYDTGIIGLYVYNFSASTGAMLSDAEVFAAFGMTESEGREKIRTSLGIYWDEVSAEVQGVVSDSELQQLREETLADRNINSVRPYIDSNGKLRFAGTIYSFAGAGSYDYLFDDSGNTWHETCKVH